MDFAAAHYKSPGHSRQNPHFAKFHLGRDLTRTYRRCMIYLAVSENSSSQSYTGCGWCFVNTEISPILEVWPWRLTTVICSGLSATGFSALSMSFGWKNQNGLSVLVWTWDCVYLSIDIDCEYQLELFLSQLLGIMRICSISLRRVKIDDELFLRQFNIFILFERAIIKWFCHIWLTDFQSQSYSRRLTTSAQPPFALRFDKARGYNWFYTNRREWISAQREANAFVIWSKLSAEPSTITCIKRWFTDVFDLQDCLYESVNLIWFP